MDWAGHAFVQVKELGRANDGGGKEKRASTGLSPLLAYPTPFTKNAQKCPVNILLLSPTISGDCRQ
jgi:hypothetical protein